MIVVIDDVLKMYGMGLNLYPYRIVDMRTGKVVQEGPTFDLRHDKLLALRKSFDVRQSNQFKRSDGETNL
jgi:hypothetical protein